MPRNRTGIHTLCLATVFLLSSCQTGYGPSLDPESREFYDKARLIMTKEEKQIFKYLPDKEDHQEFIRDFWIKRDPDPETEENEFKQEFNRRIEFANRYFGEGIPGWKTDRGRIYIYFGNPDKFEERPFLRMPEIKGLLLWFYYDLRFNVQFVDRRGDGSYSLYRFFSNSGLSLQQQMEEVQMMPERRRNDDFEDRHIDFVLEYDQDKKNLVLSLPVDDLVFSQDEDGRLNAEFDFIFYLYKEKGPWNEKFKETKRLIEVQGEILKHEEIIYSFPFDLSAGNYYVDVIVLGSRGMRKTRKLFKIEVFGRSRKDGR